MFFAQSLVFVDNPTFAKMKLPWFRFFFFFVFFTRGGKFS